MLKFSRLVGVFFALLNVAHASHEEIEISFNVSPLYEEYCEIDKASRERALEILEEKGEKKVVRSSHGAIMTVLNKPGRCHIQG